MCAPATEASSGYFASGHQMQGVPELNNGRVDASSNCVAALPTDWLPDLELEFSPDQIMLASVLVLVSTDISVGVSVGIGYWCGGDASQSMLQDLLFSIFNRSRSEFYLDFVSTQFEPWMPSGCPRTLASGTSASGNLRLPPDFKFL